MAIETDSPSIPTIEESEVGRGRRLFDIREFKHQTFFGRRRRLQTSEHGYEGAVVPAKIQT